PKSSAAAHFRSRATARGSLVQQGTQVGLPSLGDGPELGLASTGMLSWHQAQPRAKLRAVLKLLEVSHRGHDGRGSHRPHPDEPFSLAHLLIGFKVGANALV